MGTRYVWSPEALTDTNLIAGTTSLVKLYRIHLPCHRNAGSREWHIDGYSCNPADELNVEREAFRLVTLLRRPQHVGLCATCSANLGNSGRLGTHRTATFALRNAAIYRLFTRTPARLARAYLRVLNTGDHVQAVLWTNTVTSGGPDIEGAWWQTLLRRPVPRDVARRHTRLPDRGPTRTRALIISYDKHGIAEPRGRQHANAYGRLRMVHAVAEHTRRHLFEDRSELWVSVIDAAHIDLLTSYIPYGVTVMEIGTLDANQAAQVAEAALEYASEHPGLDTLTGDDREEALRVAGIAALVTHA